MRRLASALAAVLALTVASSARAEPLDLDLVRLGPATPEVWAQLDPAASATVNYQRALDSRRRFAILSSEMALAVSSAVLHPASTTGHSGFAVDLESAVVGINPDAVGDAGPVFSATPWATRRSPPDLLYLPSVHVRKGLPFSFELGGRVIYLAQSSYFAAQGEAKWAHEGLEYAPDLGVRVAYTRLVGQKDWDLGTTDLDLMVSKRWGVSGVTSLTPYAVARFAFVSASSDRMDFGPTRDPAAATSPADLVATEADFPRFRAAFYRTTLGLRFTTYAVSLAAEATYFAGARRTSGKYQGVEIDSSLAGAAKLGFEF